MYFAYSVNKLHDEIRAQRLRFIIQLRRRLLGGQSRPKDQTDIEAYLNWFTTARRCYNFFGPAQLENVTQGVKLPMMNCVSATALPSKITPSRHE